MRPRIFVTQNNVQGLRSLESLRESVKEGHSKILMQELRVEAEQDMNRDPYTPESMVPGRDRFQAEHGNRDYVICDAAGQRVMRAALMSLITGDFRYRDEALRQMGALFDTNIWPIWRDQAEYHERYEADLRTGMLTRDLSLAYDWLYPNMTESQRKWVVAGIDRCGIQPYLASIKVGAWWADSDNNWMTCIVGGLGIAGLALGEDHPDSRMLIDYSLPRLEDYLKLYGPKGEFNESVGYASATSLAVIYFMALYYETKGRYDFLAAGTLANTCRWYMYFTIPPGRYAAFGDGFLDAPSKAWYYTAVAMTSRDEQLQWFYLNHQGKGMHRNLPLELLWFDPSLRATSPEGHYPLGAAFPAHGGCISTRTSWDWERTACMVYSKAGKGEEKHGHHDAGQVCIDAHGERLIVDLGAPYYPNDYFGSKRYEYYNASVKGHNVLVIGDRETRTGEQYKAHLLNSNFDDSKGGYWQFDLTGLYQDVKRVVRTVVHLYPGHIVVLDEAWLLQEQAVALRWHTANQATPASDGSFTVQAGQVSCACRVIELNGQETAYSQGTHQYQPPYHRNRLGDLLEQKHESFVEASLTSTHCRFLSLFSVCGPGEEAESGWCQTDHNWSISTREGIVQISMENSMLIVAIPEQQREWRVTTQ